VGAAAVCLWAVAATAHVPMLRGRLIDLVTRSNLIVVGVVQQVRDVTPVVVDTTIHVDHVLVGNGAAPALTFRGPTRFAPAARYVFFLHRDGTTIEGLQASGTTFPAAPADDATYGRTIDGIRHALDALAAQRVTQLRAALIPALSAGAAPLRYHAALELEALVHEGHPLTDTERAALDRVRQAPTTDPALQPILTDLLQRGG